MARLTQALQIAMGDATLRKQMEALGVDLAVPAEATPAAVSALIERGLRDDVPALKAKGEFID